MQSVENLTEIIQQVVQEEEQPKPEPEPEPVKKKRVPTEKQLAALTKGRETRARNKVEKDRMKNVKLKMLEKIHDRVESFDMNALIRKMDEIVYKPPPTPKLEKPKKKIVVEEPPEIEPPTPPPEEQEEEEEVEDNFFTRQLKNLKTPTQGSFFENQLYDEYE